MTEFQPESPEQLALILRSGRGSFGVKGTGNWAPPGADNLISTALLNRISDFSQRDLTVTAGAGVKLEELADRVEPTGVWASWDPPGYGRTVGSVVATAGDGPLSLGCGRIRDQLLGLTMVTWAGEVVTVGGRVMKNVAGFDLTRLACGSFGALGVITSVNLRLRAIPPADRVLTLSAGLAESLEVYRAVVSAGIAPAALELVGHSATSGSWILAARLMGSETSVAAQAEALSATIGRDWEGGGIGDLSEVHGVAPVTLRVGTHTTSIPDVIELLRNRLPGGRITAGAGATRWSGDAGAEALSSLRTAAAALRCPVTLERAPWDTTERVGVFGALDPGHAAILERLRRSFDPNDLFCGGANLVVD